MRANGQGTHWGYSRWLAPCISTHQTGNLRGWERERGVQWARRLRRSLRKLAARRSGIDPGDEPPPRLSRDPKPAPPANSAPAAGKTPSSSTPAGSNDGPTNNGDGPPRLTKSEAPASAPPPKSPAPGQDQTPGVPSGPPASEKKDGEAKPDTRANVPASDSGAREGNRPVLRRGKPAESFADEDVPGYSKPGAAAPSGKDGKVVEASAAANRKVAADSCDFGCIGLDATFVHVRVAQRRRGRPAEADDGFGERASPELRCCQGKGANQRKSRCARLPHRRR